MVQSLIKFELELLGLTGQKLELEQAFSSSENWYKNGLIKVYKMQYVKVIGSRFYFLNLLPFSLILIP